ncbi:MAG TPA: GNAT family N-acetyltransferase [Candidatus Agrococcus pullicola]|uniref:GNAT family N-acetyltransferase n=1 Tax=Candidatus Agrococcus pullicola TaxID=2838429 RepID=A0A9D2C9Y3_9MICO|nr:GNAT family N-acetyltransferase [Candidatus Agrococcus pullicola]
MNAARILLNEQSFTVRRARSDDVEDIVALLRDDDLGASRESEDLGPYSSAFQQIDSDSKHFLAVIERADGEIAGTMHLTLLPGLSRNAATRMQVEAVRVARSARGIGLGTAMFQWAHDYGRGKGAALVQLTTDKERPDACRFYRSLGYADSHEGFKLAL